MRALLFLLLPTALLCQVSCKKSNDEPTGPPLITGFTPIHGAYNSSITIKGQYLGGNGAEKTVKINGIVASVINATDTSITIRVPLKAGDGKISVTRAGKTVESANPFLYDYRIIASTFAGDGSDDYLDGQGIQAKLNSPTGMTIDMQDNIYMADKGNYCIRKITPLGYVSTFAGNPQMQGYADGKGSIVRLGNINDIKYEKTESALYIVDDGTYRPRVRKIASDGQVSTLAGGGTNMAETVNDPLDAMLPYRQFYAVPCLTVDANKNVYVVDTRGQSIRKINSTGVTTLAGRRGSSGYQDGQGANALFSNPGCIITTNDGNLLVADPFNYRLRKITSSGLVSTFAGNGNNATTDANNALDASFTDNIMAIAQDSQGNTYLMDDYTLRLITPGGRVVTLTSNERGYADGNGSTAAFGLAGGMVADSHDNLFISDIDNNRIRKVVIQ